MKKITPSNIIFTIFLVLLIIPTTRTFLQVNMQRILAKVIPASTINEEDQKSISNYNTQLNGVNTTNLNLNTAKGEVIFVNFWATWCPPCIAEMPDLEKLYNTYKNNITFAFVTTDSKAKIESFLKENNLSLPIYQLGSEIPKELEYTSLPTTFIIDKKGAIVLHKTGVANWNSNGFYKKLDQLISSQKK